MTITIQEALGETEGRGLHETVGEALLRLELPQLALSTDGSMTEWFTLGSIAIATRPLGRSPRRTMIDRDGLAVVQRRWQAVLDAQHTETALGTLALTCRRALFVPMTANPRYGLRPEVVALAIEQYPDGRWTLTEPLEHRHDHVIAPQACLWESDVLQLVASLIDKNR